MITAKELEAHAAELDQEARAIEAKLSEGGLAERDMRAAQQAVVEPRLRAADALRAAANRLRAIPAMGIG